MREVARAAGVHQTTVSLALRNDPRLPENTRSRIQEIATQIGYRPDPMLTALNHYRYVRQEPKSPTHIAFLLNFHDRAELNDSYRHRLFVQGACEQAEKIGFALDTFFIGHRLHEAGPRIERVLEARGIVGVILAAFGDQMAKFKMNWDRFSIVRIESQQLDQPLHTVSSNQMGITREAVRRLSKLGYRRIGLAVGESDETCLRNAFSAGYHVEVALHPRLSNLPPLLFPDGMGTSDIAPALANWIRSYQIEVIISNWHEVPEALQLAGLRRPDDIVVATLDLNPDRGANAGIRQNHGSVGERAVEQVAILMRTHQRGLGRPRNSTLIDGEWVDGSDVPPRNMELNARATHP